MIMFQKYLSNLMIVKQVQNEYLQTPLLGQGKYGLVHVERAVNNIRFRPNKSTPSIIN